MKTGDAVEGFHLLENSHKLCQGFQQAMEARITCSDFFYKMIIFSVNKEKDDIQTHTVNSYNSETVKPHCSQSYSCFIAL